MFDSVKNFFNRNDKHDRERKSLEEEARQFKLPGENLPAAIKIAVFVGLAALNVRLFSQLAPGPLGVAISCLAVASEALALYSFHNFSRTSGWFRIVLGLSGIVFGIFAVTHATFSFFDLVGIVEFSETVHFYSRVIAFPLLFGLVAISTVAMGLTHPRGLIRFAQAKAHTQIVQGRATAASELELLRAQAVIEEARLHNQEERIRREGKYLESLDKVIAIEQEKRRKVAAIPDPELRAAMARELGIEVPPAGPESDFPDEGRYTNRSTDRPN